MHVNVSVLALTSARRVFDEYVTNVIRNEEGHFQEKHVVATLRKAGDLALDEARRVMSEHCCPSRMKPMRDKEFIMCFDPWTFVFDNDGRVIGLKLTTLNLESADDVSVHVSHVKSIAEREVKSSPWLRETIERLNDIIANSERIFAEYRLEKYKKSFCGRLKMFFGKEVKEVKSSDDV